MNARMKTLQAFVVAALLLGLAACPPGEAADAGQVDAGPPVLAEKEPNNGPESALVLERTAIVEANLAADPKAPDEDWFVLKAALPRTVALTATCPPGADVALEVMDEARNVLASVNNGGPGQPERLPDLDVSGKALVRVVGLKKGAGGAYTLTAVFSERVPGFELEPNDRRVDATSVPLGQAVSAYLGHANDVDWFRYELPAQGGDDAGGPPAPDAGSAPKPGEAPRPADAGAAPPAPEPRLALRVDLSAVDGVSYDVQVLTEAEAVLFSAKSRLGGGLSLRNVGVRANDRVLYVVVKSNLTGAGKDAKRGSSADTYYTLTVAPEEAGASAELEPNDEPGKATELPANGYREGFISPKGDVDYFKLTTGGPSIARLRLTGVEKVDLVLSVVTAPDGKPEETLLKVNEGGVKEPEQLNNVRCDGSCLIKVEAAARKVDGKWVKEDENGDQSYRLSTTVVPDDGSEEREPNNDAEHATPLSFGAPMRGTIYPKKDVDYFKLDLSARQVKTPLSATLLGILKVDVGLYLHRVEADGKLTLVQTSDGAKGEKPETVRFAAEPGVYVFEVRDTKNREANFQDSYQLTVDESGE